MKNRKKQRINRKIKNKEEMLDKKNLYGYMDLTPYEAVLSIRKKANSTGK